MEELKKDVLSIKKEISEINTTLKVNTEILDIHIKRTQLNEDRIQKLEYWLLGLLAAILVASIKF